MGSLFDIPAQLAMVLSLVASNPAEPSDASLRAVSASPAAMAVETLDGPMRFSERAWLQALHDNPEQSGGYASRVFVTSSGRYYVPTAGDRIKILAARQDVPLATRVLRAAAESNARILRSALKRAPSAADLYIAHVLGTASAISFLKTADEVPDARLRERFPALSAVLSPDAGAVGGALTVGEFYRRLCGVMRSPPRLVAIGLKSNFEDAAKDDLWQAKVELANSEPAAQ